MQIPSYVFQFLYFPSEINVRMSAETYFWIVLQDRIPIFLVVPCHGGYFLLVLVRVISNLLYLLQSQLSNRCGQEVSFSRVGSLLYNLLRYVALAQL